VSAVRPLTVLVVDDDPRVRGALVRMLDELPDVEAAALDTEQAIRLSALTAIGTDVAVVDLPGSRARGEELVRRLAPAVPVVAVSLDGALRRRALGAGAAAFLEKDGDDRSLVAAIRSAAASTPMHNVAVDPDLAPHHREGTQRCPTT
jgi:DNA-binding NarL/FixJ family response regulator